MTTVNTPTTPKAATTGATLAPIERQFAIETALADALHFSRLPASAWTLNAATARTRRALTLLKQACAEAKIGGAA